MAWRAGTWALESERSRLPSDVTYLREGQIWEAVRDCEGPFQASISSRPKGAASAAKTAVVSLTKLHAYGTGTLHRGKRLRVVSLDGMKALFVNCVPVRYEDLHQKIIFETTRNL